MIADSARLFCLFCQDLPSRAVFSSASWSADVILHGDHRAANSWGWRTREAASTRKRDSKHQKMGIESFKLIEPSKKKIQKHLWPSKDGTQVEAITSWAQLVEPGFGKDSKSRLRLLRKHILMLDCCCHSSFLKQMCFFLTSLKAFLQEISPALFAVFMRRACKAKHSWHWSRAWCSFNRWKKET